MERGRPLPPNLVGTSAGAAIAAACLTTGPIAALEACRALYADNLSNFRWRSLLNRRVEFAHQRIYPAWIGTFVSDDTFPILLKAKSRLVVAVSRPSRVLGLAGSVGVGTLAYIVDKKVWHSLHPRLPRVLGLRLDFLPIDGCATAAEALRLLCASAAPPPILPARRVAGRFAFDGGYTDNAPMPQLSAAEQAISLTLLTRHYPQREPFFRHGQRWYAQPSRPVPVSTWDCTYKATVDAAFALGQRDALGLERELRSRFPFGDAMSD